MESELLFDVNTGLLLLQITVMLYIIIDIQYHVLLMSCKSM
jgi:hypothetical protein